MATPHMHVYRRNDTERQSKASLCNNGLLFCVKALAITKVSNLHAGAGKKTGLSNRRIQHCWSRTQQLWSVSYVSVTGSFVVGIHSSRVSLFCSDHLQGRHYFRGRGREPSRSITSSIPSWFIFSRFIFHGSRSVCENCENLHPAKISC